MKPYPYTRRYLDRGKWRIDFRRFGRTIPLKGEMGTADFQQAYDAAKALFEHGPPSNPRSVLATPKHGTFRWLAVEYFKSSDFKGLGPVTQGERRRLIDQMLLEPSSPGSSFLFGDYPVSDLTDKHVRVLRDRKADARNAANHRLKALKVMFGWAVEQKGMKRNWAMDVHKLQVHSDGHHTWTDDERELFKRRHPVGSMARLAYELFFHTGQRLGDVAAFGPGHVQNGKLVFTQEKNEQRKPVKLELPILPELRKALDATATGDQCFLVSGYGQPFASKKSFGNWFADRVKEAGLPQHCTAHGLRKASATFHANLGASANELMAIFGWRSLRSAEVYVRDADQKKNAARAMERVRANG